MNEQFKHLDDSNRGRSPAAAALGPGVSIDDGPGRPSYDCIEVQVPVRMRLVVCGVCGCSFAVPWDMYLIRRERNRRMFCPGSGHGFDLREEENASESG